MSPRARAWGAGNARELDVGAVLVERGWVIASRRHVAGGGDWLAAKAGYRALLIEVKSTAQPFDHFGPARRAELVRDAEAAGATPLLAWWPPGVGRSGLRWIPARAWPS